MSDDIGGNMKSLIQKTPYEYGYEASSKNEKCPHDESTWEQADWWEGWLDAANDSVDWEGEQQ